MREFPRLRLPSPILPSFVAMAAVASLAFVGCAGSTAPAASKAGSPRITTVQGPAGALHVDDGGTGGLPVLFVHGLAGDSSVWSAQLAHLRLTRRAIALDLRGHGASAPPADGDYSVPSMAADVSAVADALGLKRFVLVGHSWGGPISAAYAGRHPDRLAGLLFADPAGDLSRLSPKEIEGFRAEIRSGDTMTNVKGFFSKMLAASAPGVASRVTATVEKAPPALFLSAWDGMFAYSPAADLARFNGPMLAIITPENKESYSLQNVDRRIAVVEMTGVSHWLMMDKPDAFDAAMDAFLGPLGN